jgi:hypothetical protein
MRILVALLVLAGTAQSADKVRVGMIGLDTSHSLAFTKVMNASEEEPLKSCEVIAAYPQGSPDIESSVSRIPKYTAEMREMGIEIVEDIPVLLTKVDAVLLETNDGRPHLEQVTPVLKAGKPCFIDKPIAGSLVDCLAIFKLAEHYKTPVFSSSSLRFGKDTQAARNGALGDIHGCSTWSPCSLEKTHPDLFWYGIHGVESLFTVMGAGVHTVTRTQTDDFELVTGIWNNGRIGTFRGIRAGKSGYGGTAFGSKSLGPVGSYDGYAPLVVEIARFFHTREVPIDPAETIDIYAFMEAADESKRQGFGPVSIEDVLKTANAAAQMKVEAIIRQDSE